MHTRIKMQRKETPFSGPNKGFENGVSFLIEFFKRVLNYFN